jgi:micrococcal nuclease
MNLYTYKAKVMRVIDGDTIELTIDLGYKVYWNSNCRLHGINAPELKGDQMDAGLKAREFLRSRLPVGRDIVIRSKSLDKYGRPIVEIINMDGTILNDQMVEAGYAKEYMK